MIILERRLVFILLFLSCQVFAAVKEHCTQALMPPHLIIGIDGVPYETFNKSVASGHFSYLNSVLPMISSFPSTSDHNWNRMMGSPLIESYTMEHFSVNAQTRRGQGKRVGGLYLKINPPVGYFKAFDASHPSVSERLTINAFLETSARYYVRSFAKEYCHLSTSGRNSYKVLIGNSDMIAHLCGEQGVLEFLEYLDKRLTWLIQKTYQVHRQNPHITLLSDHGNAFVDTKYIPYREYLKDSGWRLASTLATENEVAIVLSEILSFGAFYTLPHRAEKLAMDLRGMPGADIVAYTPSPHQVIIYKQDEKALISIDYENSKVFYAPLNGDPLEQKDLFQGEFLSFEDYLSKSYNMNYPYAAVTLWEAFYKNTLESASVLVSTLPDHALAGRTLYWLSKLQGKVKSLHGALYKTSSRGIFATTEHLPVPAVSLDAVRHFLQSIEE